MLPTCVRQEVLKEVVVQARLLVNRLTAVSLLHLRGGRWVGWWWGLLKHSVGPSGSALSRAHVYSWEWARLAMPDPRA